MDWEGFDEILFYCNLYRNLDFYFLFTDRLRKSNKIRVRLNIHRAKFSMQQDSFKEFFFARITTL